jgi:D-alanyl-D-alanine carboxypeptidase (penicillin-binding protein 5/6)
MGRLRLVAHRPVAAGRRPPRRHGVGALAAAATSLLLAGLAPLAAATAPPRPLARAWLVENARGGQLLASHAASERLPIASITKLMTLIVALGHLNLDQIVTVDPRAAAVGQESVYLTAGEQISVSDLVKAALIQSANDAADALALATAPSFPAFAELMNAKARELGLVDSHFVRPDGLDAADEYSSAHDVTLLARDAMRIPVVAATVRMQSATIAGGRVLHTWNDLLGVFPGVFGVKTGHTSAAGWCQVAAASEDGTTIYATILGSPSRAQRDADLERLLAYGLAQYREVDAIASGRVYAEVGLPYGAAALPLVAAAPLALVVPVGTLLSERVVAPISLRPPLRAGAVLGRVQIFESGRLVGQRALVAARSVASAGLAGRIGWYAGRTVHDLVSLVT